MIIYTLPKEVVNYWNEEMPGFSCKACQAQSRLIEGIHCAIMKEEISELSEFCIVYDEEEDALVGVSEDEDILFYTYLNQYDDEEDLT